MEVNQYGMKIIEWTGKIPNCDFCGEVGPFDAKTKFGPWANMCKKCLESNGSRLSIGTEKVSK